MNAFYDWVHSREAEHQARFGLTRQEPSIAVYIAPIPHATRVLVSDWAPNVVTLEALSAERIIGPLSEGVVVCAPRIDDEGGHFTATGRALAPGGPSKSPRVMAVATHLRSGAFEVVNAEIGYGRRADGQRIQAYENAANQRGVLLGEADNWLGRVLNRVVKVVGQPPVAPIGAPGTLVGAVLGLHGVASKKLSNVDAGCEQLTEPNFVIPKDTLSPLAVLTVGDQIQLDAAVRGLCDFLANVQGRVK